MAKKTKINKEALVAMYMNTVLDNNETPKSVYAFAKMNNFQESKFYSFFGNFEALESSIYELFFEKTMTTLKNDIKIIKFHVFQRES